MSLLKLDPESIDALAEALAQKPRVQEQSKAPRLFTVQEAAEQLGVDSQWLYCRKGKRCKDPVPHRKMGKYVRFSLEDLEEIIAKTASRNGKASGAHPCAPQKTRENKVDENAC
jgi:hypothetical protein